MNTHIDLITRYFEKRRYDRLVNGRVDRRVIEFVCPEKVHRGGSLLGVSYPARMTKFDRDRSAGQSRAKTGKINEI